jgi:hypothetical protein
MAQSIPARSSVGNGPSKGSSDKNRTAAGVVKDPGIWFWLT